MPEELIEELDWDGNIVAVHPKSYMKQRMFIHKVSLVIPKTEKNKYILSRRAKDKQPWPNVWVCAIGGKVVAKESYEEAAIRETKEEAGIEIDPVYVTSFKFDSEWYKAIFKVFTTKEDIDIRNLAPDQTEVQYFRSFTLDEIKDMVKEKPEEFAPTFIVAIKEFIRDIKKVHY
jgi:isopentenyldiphosphate isomerase